jgi:hypothetical protein
LNSFAKLSPTWFRTLLNLHRSPVFKLCSLTRLISDAHTALCFRFKEQVGLSKMIMDEINTETKAVRDAKTHS